AYKAAAPAYKPINKPTYSQPAPAHKPPHYKEEAKPFAYDYAVSDHYTGTNFVKKEEITYEGEAQYPEYHPAPAYKTAATAYKTAANVYKPAGYNADVTYEGEAQFPEYYPAPAYKVAGTAYKSVHKSAYSNAAPAYKPATY
ncbi:adhesive plaque matrix protein-like, partial [Pollicipes pollicipes]|uniref:adhesive plaque matrix protein-like n=1 Tax=Pollicipes pollicipes TaxID=41117 RepID=UPI00188552F0